MPTRNQGYKKAGVSGRSRVRQPWERKWLSEESANQKTNWQEPFLEEYAKAANFSAAVKKAGTWALRVMNYADTNPDFARAMKIAERAAVDKAWQAAWEEGVEGVFEDVYYEGEVVGQKLVRDTKMTQFVLKVLDPQRFSERFQMAALTAQTVGNLEERRQAALAAAQERRLRLLPPAEPAEIIDVEVVEDDDVAAD